MNISRVHTNSMPIILITIFVVTLALLPQGVSAESGRGTEGRDATSSVRKTFHDPDHDKNNARRKARVTSADKFVTKYEAILAKLDNFVIDNDLTIDNGIALRQAVITNEEDAKTQITALKALKEQLQSDSTDAQRVAFKVQLDKTRTSLKAFRESLRAYKQAIRAATKTAGVTWPYTKH